MVLKWTQTKPEPLKYFEPELNPNPNRYLKRFDTLVLYPFLLIADKEIFRSAWNLISGGKLFFKSNPLVKKWKDVNKITSYLSLNW